MTRLKYPYALKPGMCINCQHEQWIREKFIQVKPLKVICKMCKRKLPSPIVESMSKEFLLAREIVKNWNEKRKTK